jgi:Phosphate uptake regulator
MPDQFGLTGLERRKVWKIKGGSYILALPKHWVENNKTNEVIVIVESDNVLRITSSLDVSLEREVEIDYDKIKDPRTLEYFILTYYMQGISKIKVTTHNIFDSNIKKRLRDLRDDMLGAEIVEDKSNIFTFEMIVDISTYHINDTVKNINYFINDIHSDTVKAIETLDKQLANEILGRIKEGLRKYRFMVRQIALAANDIILSRKIGIENPRHAIVYGTVASYLNRMLHHTVMPNSYLTRIGKVDAVANDFIQKMAESAYNMRNGSINALINRDIESAVKIIRIMSLQKDLEDELLNYLFTGNIETTEAISYSMIAKEFRRISGFSVGVCDAVANLVLAPKRVS